MFLITLVMALASAAATFLLGLIPVVGELIATIVVTPAFALSTIQIFLSVTAGNKPEVKDAFGGFSDFWAAFKVTFLTGLYTFLWSLLFVIPGIIKAFSYSMAMYVLAENKGMSARECIKASKAMTDGHKWELFVLDLSFFGWALLVTITFGIASIWVIPYMHATLVNVYNELKPKTAPVEPVVIAE